MIALHCGSQLAQRIARLVLALALGVLPAAAQRGALPSAEIDKLIIEYMKAHDVPGLSLAIAQAPYITRVTCYGIAGATPEYLVGANTVFDIGQIEEAFTAVAILQLVEEGKLKLDEPIGSYLRDLDPAEKAITTRYLLLQASGIPAPTIYREDHPEPMKLDFPPGTRVQRRDSNADRLSALVIACSGGADLLKFVREGQFDRLGLKHTYYHFELPAAFQKPLVSAPHTEMTQKADQIDPFEVAVGRIANRLVPFAEPMQIFSTASDMSIWTLALSGEILIKDPELRKLLCTPAKLKDGTVATTPGDAPPFVLPPADGSRDEAMRRIGLVGDNRPLPTSGMWVFPGRPGMMSISGNAAGFSSHLCRFTAPADLLTVTLLANQTGLDLAPLALQIAKAIDPKLDEAK